VTAQSSIEVAGLKDALRTLNELDKPLRRRITSDYKEIVQPILTDAKHLTPTKAPLSGFNRNWTPRGSSEPVLPYGGGGGSRQPRKPSKREMNFPGGRRQMVQWMKWQADQKAYISGKKPRTYGNYTRNLAAFGVRWQGPTAVLFDTSGQASTPQGARMIAALNSRFGNPSRVMWRAYQKADSQVQRELENLVKQIMRDAEQAIKNNRSLR